MHYALCNDRPTLRWFANQRAVEYHPTLSADPDAPRARPRPAGGRGVRRRSRPTALLVREALADAGLAGAVKTSGAKGVHIFVPIAGTAARTIAAATRALAARAAALDPAIATTAYFIEEREGKVFVDATRAGGATVVAAYSPRIRPGAPVSFPVGWDDLERIAPRDFTIRTVPALLGDARPVGGGDARAAGAARGPGRGGSRDPDRPGRRDARGQAPQGRGTEPR